MADQQQAFHTFEITIHAGDADAGYPVRAAWRNSDGLRTEVDGRFSLDYDALIAQKTDFLAYGQSLGEALFAGKVREAFHNAFQAALSQEPGRLRLLLAVESQDLRYLRWERLCAPFTEGWHPVAMDKRLPFARYLPGQVDRRYPPFGRNDLRALIVAASPDTSSTGQVAWFDVARAVDPIQQAFAQGEISTTVLADLPTLAQIHHHLGQERFTLLHIICHGQYIPNGEPVLYLADSTRPGAVIPVSAAQLIETLGNAGGSHGLPHCIFLASCEGATAEAADSLGSLAERLVRELGTPAVIAMTGLVEVETVTELAKHFYQNLQQHGQVDYALVEATAGLAGRDDILLPALFSRLDERPLFSDSPERSLTRTEIQYGLERLAQEVTRRAPVLEEELQAARRQFDYVADVADAELSQAARNERQAALQAVDVIAREALDISFAALARGTVLPAYDDRCPFPGMLAFDQENRDFFFGRDDLVQSLCEKLQAHPFLAVTGPSGCGKSSLVLAGLLPEMRSQHPHRSIMLMTPGAQPLERLAAETPAAGEGPAILVVDQFEELFTLCNDEPQRREFIRQLLAPTERTLIIAMRADFLDECAHYPALHTAMHDHQARIEPMTSIELQQAIEQQAWEGGLRIEEELIRTLRDDLMAEPGAMPLLQHVLHKLWQRRRGRWIRAADYFAMGRIQKILAPCADSITSALSLAEKGLHKAIDDIQQMGDCVRCKKSLLSPEPDEKRKPVRRSSRPKRRRG